MPRLRDRLDAFRHVPADLSEASCHGGLLTVVALGIAAVLVFQEIAAFTDVHDVTQLVMDATEDSMIRVNFDVAFPDLPCAYLSVGVWDSFGTDRINVTSTITKQRLDAEGAEKGHPYTEEELREIEDDSLSKVEREELDSDWKSSSDHFHHDSFDRVVQAHDVTLVLFYTRRTKHEPSIFCEPCKKFRPVWDEFEREVNAGAITRALRDADGRAPSVRALRINCADFHDVCAAEQKVTGFPTVRLYRKRWAGQGSGGDGATGWQAYHGGREVSDLTGWAHEQLAKMHTAVPDAQRPHPHRVFDEGCRAWGYLDVAKVPGTLHFEARHAEDTHLNYATTNVSHHVHHLSFGAGAKELAQDATQPADVRQRVAPIDGRSFTTARLHQAPRHFIQAVATTLPPGAGGRRSRSYQLTHQHHLSKLAKRELPKAALSYDLAAVEVIVSRERGREWYGLATFLLAVIGGTWSTFSILAAVGRSAVSRRG